METTVARALGSGLAGACALTALHEGARHVIPRAPRMDVLGMEAIARSLRRMGRRPPPPRQLRRVALAGDLACNALYYSLVGAGRDGEVWRRGLLLGLGAGAGAVLLPGLLGLSRWPSSRTAATTAMTVGWYLAGGLAAAATRRLLGT